MRLRIARAVALVLLAAGLVALLSTRASPVDYQNGKLVNVGAVVRAGAQMCQGGQYVPPGAGSLRVWASTAHRRGGPLDLEVVEHGTVFARGSHPAGYRDQPIDIRLSTRTRELGGAEVCIRNRGRVPVALMGDFALPNERPGLSKATLLDVHQEPAVVKPGGTTPIVVRFEWRLPHAGSWWGRAGTVAQRVSLAKASFVGSWTLWLAVALMAGAGATAAWLVRREARA